MARSKNKKQGSIGRIYSLKELELLFPETSALAKKIDSEQGNCIVTAPVKSGKRRIKQWQGAYTRQHSGSSEKHVVLTSLNRKDTQTQMAEYEHYGMEAFVLGKKPLIEQVRTRLLALDREPGRVTLHIDESDYGTENTQLLASIYETVVSTKIRVVCYSATNEEVIYSSEGHRSKQFELVVGPDYKGAKWFLDNNLVYEAEPFVSYVEDDEDNKVYSLSPQAIEACKFWEQSGKALAILRIVDGNGTYGDMRHGDCLQKLLGYDVDVRFIDADNSFNWMEDYKFLVGKHQQKGTRTLLVVCQTCTRSTELGFHEHLAFLHDCRGLTAAYNTMHQAFLRIAHYHVVGHFIRVYADVDTFKLAAKYITADEYPRSISDRISSPKDSVLSYGPGDYEEVLADTKDELISKVLALHGVNITGSNMQSMDGTWKTLIRSGAKGGGWKRLTEQDINSDHYGLRRGMVSARTQCYYNSQGVLVFRWIRHSGNVVQAPIRTTDRSIYNTYSTSLLMQGSAP